MYNYLRLLFAGVLFAEVLVGRTIIYSLGISSFSQSLMTNVTFSFFSKASLIMSQNSWNFSSL